MLNFLEFHVYTMPHIFNLNTMNCIYQRFQCHEVSLQPQRNTGAIFFDQWSYDRVARSFCEHIFQTLQCDRENRVLRNRKWLLKKVSFSAAAAGARVPLSLLTFGAAKRESVRLMHDVREPWCIATALLSLHSVVPYSV